MPRIAHTLPLLISDDRDLNMMATALTTLAQSDPGGLLVLFNQGLMQNEELLPILKSVNLHSIILGKGVNVGIPRSRQSCFEYIWTAYPDISYISEIHVDMFFPQDWINILISYLETHDEPMICPGIMTSSGELQPEYTVGISSGSIPFVDINKMYAVLKTFTYPGVTEGFVHPVIHRTEALKSVGGYDIRRLTGLQGYEDDSLLVGYRYYMGTRHNWLPKCYVKTRVYHATMAQRYKVSFSAQENLKGLISQYGIEGIKQLRHIYPQNEEYKMLLEQIR